MKVHIKNKSKAISEIKMRLEPYRSTWWANDENQEKPQKPIDTKYQEYVQHLIVTLGLIKKHGLEYLKQKRIHAKCKKWEYQISNDFLAECNTHYAHYIDFLVLAKIEEKRKTHYLFDFHTLLSKIDYECCPYCGDPHPTDPNYKEDPERWLILLYDFGLDYERYIKAKK